MLHKLGYEGYCSNCERPVREEDIGSHEDELCVECAGKRQECERCTTPELPDHLSVWGLCEACTQEMGG